jgi:hypothetical protein
MSSEEESEVRPEGPNPGEKSLGRLGRSVNSGNRAARVEIMTVGPSQMKALKRRAAERAAREKTDLPAEPQKSAVSRPPRQ